MSQLLKRIILKELLSFDEQGIDLELRPLNVLIGSNGSGKSNLIEALSLLQSAPSDMTATIREGGGIDDWLWKGKQSANPSIESHPFIEVEVARHSFLVNTPKKYLRHSFYFGEFFQGFRLLKECIEDEFPLNSDATNPDFFYKNQGSHPVLNVYGEKRELKWEDLDPEKSILAQRKDPDQYPELTYLANVYSKMRFYREWSFGRNAPPRQPQKTDQRNDFLNEDCTNLGLVLNRIRRDIPSKEKALECLKELYPTVQDFDIIIEGGTAQIFLHEGKFSIPATRLSDGTLRYLCLLAILCHPNPPPLICIEEPELGLHPDVLVTMGKLLKETSKRTQLVVTTHSDVLVDCMSDSPEDVIVCEKPGDASQMRRLCKEELKDWLEDYSLGQLWTKGKIGGNRW